MSRIDNRQRTVGAFQRGGRVPLSAALLLVLAVGSVQAGELDVVRLRDGSELEGRLLSVDLDRAVIEEHDGTRRTVARVELASIEFGERELAAPVSVRVRVFDADDEVRIFVDGEPAASASELRADWVEIAPLLREGANELRAEVVNENGVWAYRWVIEVNGTRHSFACGLSRRSGCSDGGYAGRETGTLPAGGAWLYVHRSDGTVQVESR